MLSYTVFFSPLSDESLVRHKNWFERRQFVDCDCCHASYSAYSYSLHSSVNFFLFVQLRHKKSVNTHTHKLPYMHWTKLKVLVLFFFSLALCLWRQCNLVALNFVLIRPWLNIARTQRHAKCALISPSTLKSISLFHKTTKLKR